MNWKFIFCILATVEILAISASANTENVEKVEESTESPIVDMVMIDSELKTSTEKPPTFNVLNEKSEKPQKSDKPEKTEEKQQSQRHTVADFIIHPLIAFKPRAPEDDSPAGKQAPSSTTVAPPWQLFSSVSSLAGWLNDRIQLPGLVDSPVRESTTTTTTTQRPDVVVRVQQRPQSSRKPVIRIGNRYRPNQVDFDSFEEDDDEEEEEDDDDVQQQSQEQDDDIDEEEQYDDDDNSSNGNRIKNDREDEEEADAEEENPEENDENEENTDDDEEEQVVQRPNNRRRLVQQQNRRVVQQVRGQPNRRKYVSAQQPQRRRQHQQQQQQNFIVDDDESFFYGERPSMKRSQSQTGFIQRGQQSLLNQIRQLTRGQSPTEIGNTMRRSQNGANKRRQQATLFVNRNGQTVYMAPEYMGSGSSQYEYSPNVVVKKRVRPSASSMFPQPPLTIPLRRKGRPTQYITIPWSQLGIAPPDQIHSVTEGIQSKPLILNIPQSAVNQMQNTNRRKNRPVITPNAVPLLAEASLMDIFKPPKIPPSRTSNATRKPNIVGTPIHIIAKPKPNKHMNSLMPQRVRPGTIVEMAPAMEEMENQSNAADTAANSMSDAQRKSDNEFIIVGNDEEPGLTRQVQPVYGDARYVQLGGMNPYYEAVNRGGGHFALRKSGRALEQEESSGIVNTHSGIEQQIPVQVITEELQPKEAQPKVSASASKVVPENAAETKRVETVQETNKVAIPAKEVTTIKETIMPDVVAVTKA